MALEHLFDELQKNSSWESKLSADFDPSSHAKAGINPIDRIVTNDFMRGDVLHSDLQPFFESLIQDHANKDGSNSLLAIYPTPNISHANKLDTPTGFVTFMDCDAPVSENLLNDRLFRHTICVPIHSTKRKFSPGHVSREFPHRGNSLQSPSLGNSDEKNCYYKKEESQQYKGIPESHFTKERIAAMHSAIPQYSGFGPSLKNMHLEKLEDDILVPVENNPWVHELGENGSVTVHSRIEGETPTEKEFKHFIIVSSDIRQAAREFKDYILSDSTRMTYNQLVNCPQYRYLQNLSYRNACRIAQEAADSLDVHIDSKFDNETFLATENDCFPVMADPSISQLSNHFVALKDGHGRRCVQYLDSNTQSNKVRNQLLVFQGHWHPIIGLNVCEGAHDLDREECARLGIDSLIFAIPTNTGRSTGTAKLNQLPAQERGDMIDVCSKLSWEGAPAFNARMHPDAYRKIDDEYMDALRRMAYERQVGHLGSFGISKYDTEHGRFSTTKSRVRDRKEKLRHKKELIEKRKHKKKKQTLERKSKKGTPKSKPKSKPKEETPKSEPKKETVNKKSSDQTDKKKSENGVVKSTQKEPRSNFPTRRSDRLGDTQEKVTRRVMFNSVV
jgi:hypothetical protein